MVGIIIDRKSLQVEENKTILEAALLNGIYIPHLCYHPDLRPTGACRLCIVEVKGQRGFPASCATTVRDGMEVSTNTPEIIKMRKNLIWLLLSGYPGEPRDCTLLKTVVDYIGVDEVLRGFIKKPRDLPERKDEPLFKMNQNLCILCERCVRICHDVRGAGIVGYKHRGIDTTVTTVYDCSFKDADCRFCRACVEVCPSGALSDKELFTEQERDLKLLPCKNTCPAGIDIPRYLRLVTEGRFQDSLEVIREKVPFPHVLGMVCTHPCEKVCHRGAVSEPIAINAVKRFVAERDNKRWKHQIRIAPDTGKKIAIVGSGPAGLTAAWFLRLMGHSVTVFEKSSKPGGAMRVIPDYRLPKSILDGEIEEVLGIGIDLLTNTAIESIDNLIDKGFDAVFIAIGTSKGIKMGIPGEDDRRVLDGFTVLNAISYGKVLNIEGNVTIIGGGNVAIDVARSLIRSAKGSVTIMYRRTLDELPAHPEEVITALEEGVRMEFLVTPIRIIPHEKKLDVECIKMRLDASDSITRRKPIPVEGSEFTIETDWLIMAIGQEPETFGDITIDKDKRGFLLVSNNMETSRHGVFAGGDAVSGSSNVITAIQSGRAAASSIDKYLGGTGDIEQCFIPKETDDPWMGREDGFCYATRVTMPVIDVQERLKGFKVIESGIDKEAAIKEAKRCLRCQLRLSITRVQPLIEV